MILTQGITVIEAMPWKTLVAIVVVTIVGAATAMDAFRFVQVRRTNLLLDLQLEMNKTSCDATTAMYGRLGEIAEAIWSMHELALSNTPSQSYLHKPAVASAAETERLEPVEGEPEQQPRP